jgi:hypothetical protein
LCRILHKLAGVTQEWGQRATITLSRWKGCEVELALKLEPLIAAKAKDRMETGKVNPMQNSAQGTTRAELAKIAGVGQRTYEAGAADRG